MAECSLDIQVKNGIVDKAAEMLTETGQFERVDQSSVRVIDETSDYGASIMNVNSAFGEQVVKKIDYQNPSTEGQIASEKTIRDLAARMSDRIGIPVRFESDRTKQYKGKIENNTAVINLAYATLDTPVHEILGHPIIRSIKNRKNVSEKSFDILPSYEIVGYENKQGFVVINYETLIPFSTFYNTEEEAKKAIPSIINRLKSDNLYQNLVNEITNTETGRKVLDRVKKDYKYKPTPNKGTGRDYITQDSNGVWAVINTEIGLIAEFTTEKEAKNFLDNTTEEYTLEEQQEEAIVELLGLYTAERLDKVKDGKLISLIKRLLKEMKQFVRSLLRQREVEIDKLPDNMTLGDIADLLAYSNSKLILPSNEVIYTTPDNQTFKTYAEASNHISELAKSVEDVDLSNIKINPDLEKEIKEKRALLEEQLKQIEDKIREANNELDKLVFVGEKMKSKFEFTDEYKEYLKQYKEFTDINLTPLRKQEKEIFDKINEIRLEEGMFGSSGNTILNFIQKNKPYEQSKEIIEEWKKVNNIKYNPEEIYSRGQEFSSVVGAYSSFDVNLMMQNLLQHIEDNKKAGGQFAISAYTKPVDRQIGHLEGGGGKIKFKIYPQSEDILWAANTDVYSGSVWDASEKVNKDKKSELLGVSYTKYPSLQNLDAVQPNLAAIVDNLAHHHNELGIVLTGNNFRLEYDEDIPYQTKKIIDGINSILDQKYGKLVKPKINKSFRKDLISVENIYSENDNNYIWTIVTDTGSYFGTFSTERDAQNYLNNYSSIEPTQTNETLKESIQSVKSKLIYYTDKYNSEIEQLAKDIDYLIKKYDGEDKVIDQQIKELKQKRNELIKKKEESLPKIDYNSQALINTKISKLKEVAKKYPRSLIRSEVKPIFGVFTGETFIPFDKDDLPFQKIPTYSIQPSDNLINTYLEAASVQEEVVLSNIAKDETQLQLEQFYTENREMSKFAKKSELKKWKDVLTKKYPNLKLEFNVGEDVVKVAATPKQKGLSSAVRDKYFRDGSFTDSQAVLSIISQNNSWLSPLAKRLLEYNISLPIVAEDRGPYSISELKSLIKNERYNTFSAYHSSGSNSIYIATKAIEDVELEEFLVHEILHGFTASFIRENPENNIVKDLNRIFQYLKSKDVKDAYYLQNMDEMLVGFFTNPEFIRRLKASPARGLVSGYKNLWEQILDYISRIFNFSTRDMNLYNELYGIMTTVVDEGYKHHEKREVFYNFQENFDEYNLDYQENDFILPMKYSDGNDVKVFPAFRDNVPINIKRGLEGKFTTSEVANMSLSKLGQRFQKLFPQIKVEFISASQLNQDDHIESIDEIKGFIKEDTVFLVEGRFDEETTVEEFLHPVVLGLSTINPELFNNLKEEALKNYSKEYNRIKELRNEEEAALEIVTKALRDKVIENSNPSLYQQFIDFLKSVYKRIFFKSNPDIKTNNTLEDIARLLLKGGHIFKTQFTDKIFYNTDGQQWVDTIRDKIINHPKNNNIVKIGRDEGYTMNGRHISRVTTLVKNIIDEFFKGKKQSEKNEVEAKVAAEEGTEGHAAIEHIIDRHIDPVTGKFRKAPLPYSTYNGVPASVYETLNTYIEGILDLYRGIDGVVILKEQLLANVKGKRAVAGTADFIAILPTKEIHILDWKFIINRKEVHPEWKKAGWDKQLTEYKAAIQQAIGATDGEMNKYTKKARIVPFMTNYTKDGVKIDNSDIRDSRILNIETPYLTKKINVARSRYQYVTEAEVGTKNKLSELVNKIKQIAITEQRLKQLQSEKRIGVDYSVNNAINDAIQDFFLFGNIEEILNIHENTLDDIKTYLALIENTPVSDLISDANWKRTNDYILSLSELSQSITGLYPVAEMVFGEGLENSLLTKEQQENPDKKQKEDDLKERIKNIKLQSENYIRKVSEKNSEIQNESAKSEGIVGLLEPEMQVRGWWKRLFTTNKSGQTRSVLTLTKMLEKIQPKILLRINEGKLKIKDLQQNIEKHGSRKSKNLIDFLVNKESGKLNSKFTKEFWKEYTEIKESGDKKKAKEFAEKYYNVNKAREVFNREMENKLSEIESVANHQSEQQKERAATQIREYWDLDSDSATPWINIIKQIDNYLIEDEKFLKEYASDFYKELKKDKYATDFYNYIISINKRLTDLGFLSYSEQYRFIPFIPKGFTEANLKQYWDVAKLKMQVRSGEEYAEIDPITGDLKKGFAMPFIQDIFGKDKSNMSFDLFSSYSILIEHLENIEAKKNLEPFALNLLEIEKNKKVIPVGVTGKPLKQAGSNNTLDSVSSATNADYLEEYIDSLIYGIKIKDALDHRFKIEKTKEIQDPNDLNKTIIVPDRTEYYSVAKMLTESLNLIYLNTFGLNVFTPARQYFSSIGQSYFANNKHYTKEDVIKNERMISKLLKGIKSSEKRDLLFEYVMPFLNPEFEKQTNSVSVNGVRRWINMENMMYLMRASSGATQSIIANSILDNIVVINGKAYHVNDYLNDKYADLYDKDGDNFKYTEEQRNKILKQIEQERKKLKNNNKIEDYIVIKNVNGEKHIEIEGISNKDEILNRFRSLSQYYAKQVTGEGSRDEIMLSQRYAISRMFMMYRSWIPRTVKARYGGFEFNTDLNNYEWGRWGAYASVLNKSLKGGIFKLAKYALGIGMKEELIKYAQEKYIELEKQLTEENRLVTGSMMNEKEFIDMFLNNYSKTHYELKFILVMNLLAMTPFFVAGEGDDDRTKAIKGFMSFHFDRIQDEFSFYINPKSFIDILGNSIPATSYMSKLMTAAWNPVEEIFYTFSEDEKAAKKNQVIRDIMNLIPVTSQITKVIPIINPDLAEEFGMKPVQIVK